MTEKQLAEKLYYALLIKRVSNAGKPPKTTRPYRVGMKYNKTKGEQCGD